MCGHIPSERLRCAGLGNSKNYIESAWKLKCFSTGKINIPQSEDYNILDKYSRLFCKENRKFNLIWSINYISAVSYSVGVLKMPGV